jgi:hypothetical protein
MNEPQLDERTRNELAAHKSCLWDTKNQWENYRDAESSAFSELRHWASDMRQLFSHYRDLPKEVQDLVKDLEAEGEL